MKKVILAPDSFKGTMSSMEICHIMEREIKIGFPQCQVVKIPVADGGEGTVEAMLAAAGGQRMALRVKGPLGEEIDSFYGLLPGGRTAVIEMAAAAGLPMVRGREDPERTTTYGVGQLIEAAVKAGAQEILLGLGGSATNDGGCGAAAALGVKFLDEKGMEFIPAGGDLGKIKSIDVTKARQTLENVSIKIMCDVDNPLYGETGAAYIFAPQKGAGPAAVERLDKGLRHLGQLLDELEPGVAQMAGAGAAGGMGAGMTAMLGARLVSGIDGVLEAVGFEELLDGCDMVFTGEGRIDGQSLRGKVVFGVCKRAKKHGVPVVAVVGDSLDSQLGQAQDLGLSAIFTTNRLAVPYKEARLTAKEDMAAIMKSIVGFAKSLR